MQRIPSDTYESLVEHMRCLESSISAFHSSKFYEAKRIASSLRILAHTDKPESLLYKFKTDFGLEKETILFNIANLGDLSFIDEVAFYTSASTPILNYQLDKYKFFAKFPKMVNEDNWWNTLVLKNDNNTWSRDKTVRFLRNKMGGQHLADRVNDSDYSDMKNLNLEKVNNEGAKNQVEKVALISLSVYESGISMWHSVRQYIEYAAAVTGGKPEPELYKKYYDSI